MEQLHVVSEVAVRFDSLRPIADMPSVIQSRPYSTSLWCPLETDGSLSEYESQWEGEHSLKVRQAEDGCVGLQLG